MGLIDQIQKDLMEAMKAKDELRLATLRLIKTALKKQEVDSAQPLDAESELRVLNSLMKQRREAIEAYRSAGRADLAEREEAELRIIESYLPAAATDEEIATAIEEAIREAGARDVKQMGQVMKLCRQKLQGKYVDGKELADRVRARLAASG